MTEPGRQSREMSAFDAQNELAGKWMKRGIALLEENTRASLNDSVPCFEMAIRLRSALPLEINHRFRYGLAAGWMNRGDALTRLGSPENFSEALRSYDEALGQLRVLPIDENPLFRKRLAVAWLNRGITLQQQGKDFSEAVRSFEESVALLAVEQAADIPDQKQLLGCAWMNRGNGLLQLQKPDAREACKAAKQALEFLAATERADVISAEAGLKARHVLCRAIALLMAEPGLKGLDTKELVIEATDAVDDAMKLEREWELRNVTRFRALAGELFRFGVRAYQMHQPQFLVEFILESLDPKESPGASANAEMHIEAVRSLWGSLREFEKEGFRNPAGSARFEQLLQKLEELSFAENRLEELRRELQLANARVVSDR